MDAKKFLAVKLSKIDQQRSRWLSDLRVAIDEDKQKGIQDITQWLINLEFHRKKLKEWINYLSR